MRTPTFKPFFMALLLAFAAPLFAQSLTDAQVAERLGNNPTPEQIAAVATQMAESGQFTAQITAALARAGVAPAAATVAVRQAIPSASNQQLARGLAQAGVANNVAAAAIRSANISNPPQTTQATARVDPGTGAIVGTDGRVLRFDTPQQMLGAVAAFLSTQQQLSRIQISAISGVVYANRNINQPLANHLVSALARAGRRGGGGIFLEESRDLLNLLARSVSNNDSAATTAAVTAINNLIASAS